MVRASFRNIIRLSPDPKSAAIELEKHGWLVLCAEETHNGLWYFNMQPPKNPLNLYHVWFDPERLLFRVKKETF